MASDGLERRVDGIDRDVQHLYEALVQFRSTQKRHGERLGDIIQEVNRVDRKVDGLDRKVDELDRKVDGLDRKVDGVTVRVDEGFEAHSKILESHGELLRTILSRLPE